MEAPIRSRTKEEYKLYNIKMFICLFVCVCVCVCVWLDVDKSCLLVNIWSQMNMTCLQDAVDCTGSFVKAVKQLQAY